MCEVLVYFKVDSVVYKYSVPDKLLCHETIGTSKPFSVRLNGPWVVSTVLAIDDMANSTAITHHVIISLTQQ